MTPCKTQHKLFYCWHVEGPKGFVVDTVKPKEFETLHLSGTVTAPNDDVAMVVHKANLRISNGRK